ncbi:MAG TPA: DUF5689 domain-containing protein, partial [Parafilimonas sp.]|nr:DUF5689 domain-containing protein [Parafilimonas sp.]
MKTKSLLTTCNVFTIFSIACFACNKKFDSPPPYAPPNLTPTLTIAQLKAQHIFGSYEIISTDDIIEGVVIANDSSGNFYKQVIIEDTSGGIAINIDDYNLYTSYPEGRRVFVKLKGLIMYDDNKLIEIGGSKDANNNINPIAGSIKDQYVIKGVYGDAVTPTTVDITELNDEYQNTLIRLENFEFSETDTSKVYADTSTSKNAVSYLLKNCSNKSIILRTSGFASFAGAALPNGNGSITAVYSVYNSSKQLYVRDTSDVQFYNTRCNGGPATLTSIANIRSMYSGSGVKLGAYKIAGVVISDASNKNISSGSVILQDGNAGISVYFGGTIAYSLGDSIVLDVTGDSLLDYNGSLEIKALGTIKPAAVATGRTVVPQRLSIAQLSSNLSSIECTLVKISAAVATGGTTYSGNRTLTDASGNMSLFTSSAATFANNNLPTDTSDWIGYAKLYGSTKEFMIRNLSDVTATDQVVGGGIELSSSPFTLNFDDLANGLPTGVSVKISSTSTSAGADATFISSPTTWNNTSSGFKNYASATTLTASSDAVAQNSCTNRALGVKQTSATGYDPGAAFLIHINNTIGKTNLALHFLLQSLDESAGRTTTWEVQYALGENPTSFIPVTTSP